MRPTNFYHCPGLPSPHLFSPLFFFPHLLNLYTLPRNLIASMALIIIYFLKILKLYFNLSPLPWWSGLYTHCHTFLLRPSQTLTFHDKLLSHSTTHARAGLGMVTVIVWAVIMSKIELYFKLNHCVDSGKVSDTVMPEMRLNGKEEVTKFSQRSVWVAGERH